MKKSRDKEKRMKTVTNCEKCKTKQDSKSHKKNRKDKHEHCQSSKTDNVQQDENVRTQNHARNELIMTTQSENQLKMKNSYNEKL